MTMTQTTDTTAARPNLLSVEQAKTLDLETVRKLTMAHLNPGQLHFMRLLGFDRVLIERAEGMHYIDTNGRKILDFFGGFGSVGFGHNHPAIDAALARPQVMANVMTPSVSQLRFTEALNRELGRNRGGNPYVRSLCLNSGSEAVGLACRIADVNAKLMTDAGGRYAGRTIKRVVVKGAFHGRTDKPALYSDSSRKTYVQYLASYRHEDSVLVVEPYNVAQLEAAFADADAGMRDPVPVEWFRLQARRVTAAAALADGWGEPARWAAEDLVVLDARREERWAAAVRGLLRRAGVAVPRRGRGGAEVPATLRALGVTSRETDVLRLVAEGCSTREIAERLFLSPRTVEKHVERLLAKTGTTRRTELVAYAARTGV